MRRSFENLGSEMRLGEPARESSLKVIRSLPASDGGRVGRAGRAADVTVAPAAAPAAVTPAAAAARGDAMCGEGGAGDEGGSIPFGGTSVDKGSTVAEVVAEASVGLGGEGGADGVNGVLGGALCGETRTSSPKDESKTRPLHSAASSSRRGEKKYLAWSLPLRAEATRYMVSCSMSSALIM